MLLLWSSQHTAHIARTCRRGRELLLLLLLQPRDLLLPPPASRPVFNQQRGRVIGISSTHQCQPGAMNNEKECTRLPVSHLLLIWAAAVRLLLVMLVGGAAPGAGG
jgi:hypothetical protein